MGLRCLSSSYFAALDETGVQGAINDQISKIAPLAFLDEDGWCGAHTIAAIEQYQRRAVGLLSPDGRIDPYAKTYTALGGPPRTGPKPASALWAGDSQH